MAEPSFGRQADAIDAELRRDRLMSGAIPNLSTMPDLVPIALAGRGKDEALTRARELVTLVGVEVYRQRVSDLAAAMGMNAGSVSRTLARAIARQREEKAFHQRRLALEDHLAEVEASESPKKMRW